MIVEYVSGHLKGKWHCLWNGLEVQNKCALNYSCEVLLIDGESGTVMGWTRPPAEGLVALPRPRRGQWKGSSKFPREAVWDAAN